MIDTALYAQLANALTDLLVTADDNGLTDLGIRLDAAILALEGYWSPSGSPATSVNMVDSSAGGGATD